QGRTGASGSGQDVGAQGRDRPTLRFAGGLHIISGRIVVEAELDTGIAARRLRQAIHEVYGHSSEVIVVSGGGLRRGNRYVVRVVAGGESLARQTGLLDARG